ncbi:Sec-independent protein translocase subunit TatA [Streptomyces sp. NPDC058257]|uniref:Sec-independent protein translocase subunit TatA n=1 Tax=Streptomyces sp. NPDC058257 TaxID=3346409 RepID=UPI0036ECFA9B
MFGLSEIAIILIVVILVLGAKKLPELARSAGKSARILKAEAKAMKNEEEQAGEQAGEKVGEKGKAAGEAAPSPQVIHGEVIAPTAHTVPKPDSARPHSQNQQR